MPALLRKPDRVVAVLRRRCRWVVGETVGRVFIGRISNYGFRRAIAVTACKYLCCQKQQKPQLFHGKCFRSLLRNPARLLTSSHRKSISCSRLLLIQYKLTIPVNDFFGFVG